MASFQVGPAPQPGDILVVIHDFDARSGDELTLRRSERVELIELDDGFGDGWYLGKHLSRGGTGLFPGVYTARAPSITRSPQHSRQSSSVHQAATQTTHIPRLSIGSATPQATQSQPVSFPQISFDGSSFLHDDTKPSLPAAHHSTYVQRTIGEALRQHDKGQDSPVMNETLTVIDEHITDLSTPRQSLAHQKDRNDSVSDYGSHIERQSFLAGPETDEEDNGGLDEATVRSWDHIQTARHLRDIGVDASHCAIFQEQEISGDVLLDMDQNFIYMKEFDFGVMGKRLKTWHKVRDFQREIQSHAPSSKMTSDRDQNSSLEDVGRPSGPLSMQKGLNLRQSQHTPPVTEEYDDMPHPLQPGQATKRMSWAAQSPPSSWNATLHPDSPVKAPTSVTRRSRRHSSIDFGTQPDLELSSLASSHQKQSSLDRGWSVADSTQATTPASSIRPSAKPASPTPVQTSTLDLDRGYFSGNELDNRKARNRLSKSPRIGHSRQTSLAEQPSNLTSMMQRRARLSSVGSVHEESVLDTAAASKANNNKKPFKGRFRSASVKTSNPSSPVGAASPAVTNLEYEFSSNVGSPAVEKVRMQDRARKLIGFRTASEAVTPDEKSNAIRTVPSAETQRSEPLASPATGDTSPSATPSLDIDTPESTDAVSALNKNSGRPRPKTKQRTSAYTHGLLKIPPSEARKQCDHSGWMKKKSSGIMATWKPRLFILRGRRLSYYYSENDTEERGVIDISGHKVLVANDDPMITLHASVTGATKASPIPGKTVNEAGMSAPTKSNNMPNVFYFKLVPPKAGFSRAVQFTKPAIHYFQVDTIGDGRKWMGEIMKANIEHDLTSFETTNKQKTISLAKARARRERPPTLDDTKRIEQEEKQTVDEHEKRLRESGLNIQGLEFQDSGIALGDAGDSGIGTTSPKALSMLGMGPKLSLKSKRSTAEDGKKVTHYEENKENTAGPSVPAKT